MKDVSLTPLRVLGLSGSLRAASFNSALLRAAQELAPEGVSVEVFDLRPIPMFDQDLLDRGWPAEVTELRDRVRAADAILFSSPEYNYSIPGMLKNAIDWVSRPPDQPFSGKPAAIMGASPGGFGTVRMQQHFRTMSVFLNLQLLSKPEVMVSKAADKFADGRLTDEASRKAVAGLVAALADWTRRLAR